MSWRTPSRRRRRKILRALQELQHQQGEDVSAGEISGDAEKPQLSGICPPRRFRMDADCHPAAEENFHPGAGTIERGRHARHEVKKLTKSTDVIGGIQPGRR